MNNPITSTEIETDKKFPQKQKPRTRWLHRRVLSNIRQELQPILLKLFKKIAENTSKFILQGHHHPDTKTRQRQHKKRKLQANITDEHRWKNPQQNLSKQNSATHQKAHAP